jgi:putative ABC transport system permease protein
VIQDLKNSVRLLLKNPGFTVAAVLTLAIGVGGTCTMFAGVDALFLRALRLPRPDQIVTLWASNKAGGFDHANVSYRDFEDWRERARSFERMAVFVDLNPTLTGRGEPETLPVARVGGDFFTTLGGRPLLGRTVGPSDDRSQASRIAVLSHGAWRRRYGANPGVLGTSLTLDGQAYSIVGVMPPDFAFPGDEGIEVWTALAPDLGNPERGDRDYFAVARLRPGVTVAQARADLDAVSHALGAAYPKSNAGFEVNVLRIEDDLFGKKFRVGLFMLLGAVALVLGIGCANIAQLFLARSGAREREFAVRVALGASRGRIVKQLLTESAVLAVAGGTAGFFLSVWGIAGFLRLLPQGTARLPEIRLDARVFLFGLLVSAACAAAVGLLPALHASRGEFGESLRDASPRTSGGGRRRKLQIALVASEVAIAIVLLSGAGLLVKSLSRLRQVDPGFRAEDVLTMQIDLPERQFPEDDRARAFFDPLLDRLSAIPGVRAAAAVSTLPMSGNNSWTFVMPEGQPAPPPGQEPRVGRVVVTPDYFRAMSIPVLQGRPFRLSDSPTSTPVAIVNEEFARKYWPGESAIGRRFRRGRADSGRPWVEVVGVTKNVRHRGVAAPLRPEFFFPFSQAPERSMAIVLAGASDTTAIAAAARREIRALRPDQAVSNMQAMTQFVSADRSTASLMTGLLAAFALAALTLATMGLYAVVSLAVGQSTREIGIRIALGAQGRDVIRLILRRWLSTTGVGILAGLAVTLMLGRLLSTLLFGVRPTDAAVLIGITAFLAFVAALASYLPARRATRVDPMVALRDI